MTEQSEASGFTASLEISITEDCHAESSQVSPQAFASNPIKQESSILQAPQPAGKATFQIGDDLVPPAAGAQTLWEIDNISNIQMKEQQLKRTEFESLVTDIFGLAIPMKKRVQVIINAKGKQLNTFIKPASLSSTAARCNRLALKLGSFQHLCSVLDVKAGESIRLIYKGYRAAAEPQADGENVYYFDAERRAKPGAKLITVITTADEAVAAEEKTPDLVEKSLTKPKGVVALSAEEEEDEEDSCFGTNPWEENETTDEESEEEDRDEQEVGEQLLLLQSSAAATAATAAASQHKCPYPLSVNGTLSSPAVRFSKGIIDWIASVVGLDLPRGQSLRVQLEVLSSGAQSLQQVFSLSRNGGVGGTCRCRQWLKKTLELTKASSTHLFTYIGLQYMHAWLICKLFHAQASDKVQLEYLGPVFNDLYNASNQVYRFRVEKMVPVASVVQRRGRSRKVPLAVQAAAQTAPPASKRQRFGGEGAMLSPAGLAGAETLAMAIPSGNMDKKMVHCGHETILVKF